MSYKSFHGQFHMCLDKKVVEVRPCNKEIKSLHNGVIKQTYLYWCKKYDCECNSSVCRNDRILPEGGCDE